MRVFRLSLLFVLLTLLCWLAPRAAGGAIREEVADKYEGRYREWKEEFLSTETGRGQWELYDRSTHFTLTITVSADNRHGGETGKYKWDDSGELVAATIVLGCRIDEGFPNPVYYPVMNSLSLAESSCATGGDVVLYRLQNQLMPAYNKILLANGRDTRDPRLMELARRMGGTPVEIWEDREYWGEANAMLYLRDRFSREGVRCELFHRIRRSVELYAKNYAGRFAAIAQSGPP